MHIETLPIMAALLLGLISIKPVVDIPRGSLLVHAHCLFQVDSPLRTERRIDSIHILNREEASSLMPASVFFRGRTSSIQARNSTGLRLPGERLVLIAMVDTSGYSSGLQETYQAYLLTEVPLRIGNQTLAPGGYGIGFIAGNRFLVMDLGGNHILSSSTIRDLNLARPDPLQILPDRPSSGLFRLYAGRSYIVLAANVNLH